MIKIVRVSCLFIFIVTNSYAQLVNGEQSIKINGTRLFFDIQGKGKPLLIIHGGPGLNHTYFLPYLSDLSKTNKLIFYDQRACGQSAIPSADSVTLKFLNKDIEEIRKKLKVAKLRIMAHSWGAILAVNYAIQFPDKIEKLILCNPSPLSHEYDVQMAAFMKENTTVEDSLARAKIYHSSSIEVDNFEKLMKINFKASAYDRQHIEKIDLNIPDNYLQSSQVLMMGLQKDLKTYNYYSKVKGFRFKTLLLAGQYDGIPLASIERLQKLIPGAKMYTFDKSGHFPFVEETDRFIAVVNDFLKKN